MIKIISIMLATVLLTGATAIHVNPACRINGDGTSGDCAITPGGPGAFLGVLHAQKELSRAESKRTSASASSSSTPTIEINCGDNPELGGCDKASRVSVEIIRH